MSLAVAIVGGSGVVVVVRPFVLLLLIKVANDVRTRGNSAGLIGREARGFIVPIARVALLGVVVAEYGAHGERLDLSHV